LQTGLQINQTFARFHQGRQFGWKISDTTQARSAAQERTLPCAMSGHRPRGLPIAAFPIASKTHYGGFQVDPDDL